MVLITFGLWLLIIPLYPARCINCGLTRASAFWENLRSHPRRAITVSSVIVGLVVLLIIFRGLSGTPASHRTESTSARSANTVSTEQTDKRANLTPHEQRIADLKKEQEQLYFQGLMQKEELKQILKDEADPPWPRLSDEHAYAMSKMADLEKRAAVWKDKVLEVNRELAEEQGSAPPSSAASPSEDAASGASSPSLLSAGTDMIAGKQAENEAVQKPHDYFWFRDRGEARYAARDYDGAIQDLNDAIRLDPGSITALQDRGRARYAKSDYDGAIADFSEIIRQRPDLAMAICDRGVARNAKGDLEGALQDYNEAIRLKPDYAEALLDRAETRRLKGDVSGAEQDKKRALELRGVAKPQAVAPVPVPPAPSTPPVSHQADRPAPSTVPAQDTPASTPALLRTFPDRPANGPVAAEPAASTMPTFIAGPKAPVQHRTGSIGWTGKLSRGQILTISGSSASFGRIDEGALPQTPVSVVVHFPFEVVEQPGPTNGWTLKVRSVDSGKHETLIEWIER